VELNVEKLGTSVAKVQLRVPADEFRLEIQRGLRQARSSVRLKGFRPGKTPMELVEKQFGAKIRAEIKQRYVQQAYQQAVQDEELRPLAHPRVDLEDFVEDDAEGLAIDFEVSLRPEFELTGYKGMSIESELEPVLDEEVQHAIGELRRQQSHPEPAGAEGAGEDGLIVADLEFQHEGDSLVRREGLRLSALTPPPGADPAEFRQALAGAKDGDELELEVTLPLDVEKEEARGAAGTCRITVREAFRMVPPADERIFALLDVDSEEALAARVREKLSQAKEERETLRVEATLLERLIREAPIDLEGPVLEGHMQARLDQLAHRLAEQGVGEEQIQRELEEQRQTARSESEKSLKALLIIEKIGETEDLLVTEEDIKGQLSEIAERNQASVEEVRDYYIQNDMTQQMTVELLELKVRRFLRENARIETPS